MRVTRHVMFVRGTARFRIRMRWLLRDLATRILYR